MKYIKAIGYIAAAEILSLFIGLTLASSSSSFIRFISAICTVGILICLIVNFAVSSARSDLKYERINKTKVKPFIPITVGAVTSLPALISWLILYISHFLGSFDFYKWHKLLNAYYLQIYNFINSDASSSALNNLQIIIMLIPVFVPFISYTAAYFIAYNKKDND